MTQDQRAKLIDAFLDEARKHREAADEYLKNDAIFISRMAASHVCSSIAAALLAIPYTTLAKDKVDG